MLSFPPSSSGAVDRAAAPFVAASAVPAVVAALTGHRRSALSLLALPAGVTAFFRDPDRTPDHRQVHSDLVLAPADGKVMYAGPGQDGVAPPGDWQQVSIFLSLFDVHINRTPYGGTVEDVSYRPGRWHAAYRFESATENERSEITVSDTVDGELRLVVFRQIVGLVARRVVTRVQKGDVLRAGQRIGLMKFGSRMDVFVPSHVELAAAVGDRTVAGETVIARWPSTVAARDASAS
ncbi:phosphatidylserine decarboxylase [Marmoricola sp. URHB0036]|uniref:phosphatidylserine decarboxylase n=1 Tax=Marmoricola sp. URHB0036 TaxID=1298863 RepID=UPI0003F4C7E9|nr:phosphatidylserine decarboxylase [Marmoricola sp. URHB0036]